MVITRPASPAAPRNPEEAVKIFIITLLAVWALHGSAIAAPAHSKSKSQVKPQAKFHAKSAPRSYRKAKFQVRPQPFRVARVVEDANGDPTLASSAVLVIDQAGGRQLYAKNITAVQPIASITKLMTAMVVLDAKLDLAEPVAITDDDVDGLKHTRSRLTLGTVLARADLMRLALMASENRAAAALARTYPGGAPAFVQAMNEKAAELGMHRTRFVDSSGLSSENVSSAEDLAKMVGAAYRYPIIQEYTTLTGYAVHSASGRVLAYNNSNGLVKSDQWQIDVSKTGYIAEAGRCLVMQARIAAMPIVIVLLDSWGKQTRIGDANRIRKWIESKLVRPAPG